MNSKNRNGFWKLKFVSIIRYDDENFTLNIFYAFLFFKFWGKAQKFTIYSWYEI